MTIHELLSFSSSLKGDRRQFSHFNVCQELTFHFLHTNKWTLVFSYTSVITPGPVLSHTAVITLCPLSYSIDNPRSFLTYQWLLLLLSNTAVITLGPLKHSGVYLWSSLTQQWSPLVLYHTAVITSDPLLYSSDYPWSSLIQQWISLVLSHTVVTIHTHWWVTSGKIELLTVWQITCGNCLQTYRWSVVNCKNTEGLPQLTIYTDALVGDLR